MCNRPWRTGQASLQCTTCMSWIHHGNKKNCSGITDTEFALHENDHTLKWECDHCIAKVSSTNFINLPFNENCEVFYFENETTNIFNSALRNHSEFINQCANLDDPNFNVREHVDENVLTTINSRYYKVEEIKKIKPTNSSFSVAHLNISSLDKHIDDLRLTISRLKLNFDIIGLSEHKIRKGNQPLNNIHLQGYHPFIFEPTNTTHGGVGFYIREDISYNERTDLDLNSTSNYECKFIEIKTSKESIIIGAIYRHPNSELSITEFSENVLDPHLLKISNENKNCILMGDYNVNLLKTNNDAVNTFYNTLTTYNYSPFILQPTRLQAKTLIDNIMFNSLAHHSSSGNILIEISDHLLQFMILHDFQNKSKPQKSNLSKRDFKNFNEREFHQEVIQKLDWDTLCQLNQNDPNISCKNFIDTLNHQLDEYAPYRKLTKKEQLLLQKPWIKDEILEKCANRDSILKSISQETDTTVINELRNEHKRIRNELTTEKRNSKKEYYQTFFEKNKQKSSEIWKGINQLINNKSQKTSVITLMGHDDNLISDPSRICTIFNNHFSSIGRNIGNKIPTVEGSYMDYFNKQYPNGNPYYEGSNLFLTPVVEEEVNKIIDSLDLKKSTGPMSIPPYIIKIYKPFFSHWLTKLINLSFETGIFPEVLKLAKVTPIHKKESKLDYLNYRPISLLSVISKIYEKLIYTRIYDYLTTNKLINPKQFGFRTKHSTNHATISITEQIKSMMDNNDVVCGIFIDLEKAFDTVNHKILVEKLNQYGLRGNVNKLIESYLSNRKQYVSIKGFESSIQGVDCGVPQGSSLGPLLFLIYINDFRFCLDNLDSGHFADDTYLLYGGKKLKTIETIVNTELKNVSKWLRLNKLSLNAGKTEVIFFRHSHHTLNKTLDLNMHGISIKLNGKKLKIVDSVKYLGIHIDKNLSWDVHIQQLTKKLSRANGIISKLRHFAPQNVCLNVYYALFFSHLNYCCNVWGLTSEDNLNKLEVLQNKCLRIITFSDFRSHANPLYIQLNILKVRDVIKLNHLKLTFEFHKNLLPEDIRKLFNLSRSIHTTNLELNSSRKNCFHVPTIQSTHSGNKSIKYHCAVLWNDFMTKRKFTKRNSRNREFIHIDSVHHVHSFKKIIKNHFKNIYQLE